MLAMMLVQHQNVKWTYQLFVIQFPCIKNLLRSASLGEDNLSLILQPTIQWLFSSCSFCLALYLLSQKLLLTRTQCPGSMELLTNYPSCWKELG